MIEAYGKAVVVAKCKAGGAVDLADKMLRAVHMDALGAAVAKYKVKALNLQNNQLGADGGKTLAAVMSHMPSLEELKCAAAFTLRTPHRVSARCVMAH